MSLFQGAELTDEQLARKNSRPCARCGSLEKTTNRFRCHCGAQFGHNGGCIPKAIVCRGCGRAQIPVKQWYGPTCFIPKHPPLACWYDRLWEALDGDAVYCSPRCLDEAYAKLK